jgi:pimeloyl-ACP methyl ester carboxylesterase
MAVFSLGRPDAEGRALVLIHGAGGDHQLWSEVYRGLRASGVPALTLDLPGHGRSGGPACQTVAKCADAVEETLTAAGVRRYAVAGHSLGGAIALTLATRKAPGLAGVAAVATGARLYVDPMILEGALRNFACTVENVARHCVARGTAEGVWRQAAAAMAETGPEVLHADFAACAAYGMEDADLREIRLPVEVVCGDVDIMTPRPLSEELAAKIPGARLTPIPACGHMPLLEAPDALAAALVQLWRRSLGEDEP